MSENTNVLTRLEATDSTRPEWTVIGVWRGSRPVPVGVIQGSHRVEGGDDYEFPDGLWATSVTADDVAEAEEAAIREMRDEDDEEELPVVS